MFIKVYFALLNNIYIKLFANQISLSCLSFSRRQTTRERDTQIHFFSCDLDLDPMTFIYEPDMDILKMYQQLSKV